MVGSGCKGDRVSTFVGSSPRRFCTVFICGSLPGRKRVAIMVEETSSAVPTPLRSLSIIRNRSWGVTLRLEPVVQMERLEIARTAGKCTQQLVGNFSLWVYYSSFLWEYSGNVWSDEFISFIIQSASGLCLGHSSKSGTYKDKIRQRWWLTPFQNLEGRGNRIFEFEVCLLYRVSCRTASTAQKNPFSTNKKQTKWNKTPNNNNKKENFPYHTQFIFIFTVLGIKHSISYTPGIKPYYLY